MSIRFLILSDTHDTAFPDPRTLPAVDVVIHCGDLTMIGGMSEFINELNTLSRCPAELKLVIPGNHDVSLDPAWWAKCLDEDDDPEQPERVRELFASFASNGVRLLGEGTHEISLQDGRAFTVFASPYTPEFNGYAFAYGVDEDRFNTGAHTIPPEADIVITHGPPFFPEEAEYRLDRGRDGEHCGCSKLGAAIQRVRPRLHCFGHIHEGYGSQIVRWEKLDGAKIENVSVTGFDEHTSSVPPVTEGTTLLVNAAIVADEGQNKPWVVDLSL